MYMDENLYENFLYELEKYGCIIIMPRFSIASQNSKLPKIYYKSTLQTKDFRTILTTITFF